MEIPIIALGVGLIITVTAILSDAITKYKLKVEQIRADAMVRAEEVRSRNQLELERLMQKDQASNTDGYTEGVDPIHGYEDIARNKGRVRE
ncbi:MAG: hypothetical protein GXY17_07065 [Clostridiaceae bacterium]|nr:hypothetical protein [Clostridiaceae bacterium]